MDLDITTADMWRERARAAETERDAALARVRLLEGLLRDCRSLEFTAPSNLELLRRDIDAALAGAPPEEGR